jgi:hypothetical protein
MAFALEWPRTSDDSAAAAAASGASVAAVQAAAAAAAGSGRRAQYRWQLLRLYYKFPHKRHGAIIERWDHGKTEAGCRDPTRVALPLPPAQPSSE